MAIATIFNSKQINDNTKCVLNALMKLPNEVIICALQYLSIPDLINASLVLNRRVHTLAKEVLLDKMLKVDNCHLRLFINQENYWKYTIDFKLTKITDTRLAFTPVEQTSIRLYTSKLLRRPALYKASLVGPDFANESGRLVGNLIKSPIPFSVKEIGLHKHHYQQQHTFLAYQASKTPENQIKARPGERCVEPLGFECSFNFLCQPKKMIHKMFDTLHNKPTRRQIDDKSFTSSSRNKNIAEIGGLYQQKYHFLSPSEKLDRAEFNPFVGGLTASTMDTPLAH
jgi:hypothetical protein